MAHYIYQCIISQGPELFSGYGITENEEQRRATHTENLTEKGFALRDWIAHPAPSKAIAVAIEKKIKDETRTVDIKVDGFRTECAPIEQHGYITSLIIKELQKASGSSSTKPESAEEPSEDHYSNKLSDADRASYEANVRDWESLLESVWGGRITGDINRKTAKEYLADSLEALHANSESVCVYLPRGATDTPYADYWGAKIHKRVRCKKFKAYDGQSILEFELNATRRALVDIAWEEERREENAQREEKKRQEEIAEEERERQRQKEAAEFRAAKQALWDAQDPRVHELIKQWGASLHGKFNRWEDADLAGAKELISKASARVEEWDARDALVAAESPRVAQRVVSALRNGNFGSSHNWNYPDLEFIKKTIADVREEVAILEEQEERARQREAEALAPRKKILGLF